MLMLKEGESMLSAQAFAQEMVAQVRQNFANLDRWVFEGQFY